VIYGDDEDKAFRRVETLKKSGMWPGVRRAGTGCVVTFDPDELGEPAPDLPSAPQSELGWERGTHRQHEPAGSRREHGRPEAGPPLVTDAGIERVLP
jgi:hypothetical protein